MFKINEEAKSSGIKIHKIHYFYVKPQCVNIICCPVLSEFCTVYHSDEYCVSGRAPVPGHHQEAAADPDDVGDGADPGSRQHRHHPHPGGRHQRGLGQDGRQPVEGRL